MARSDELTLEELEVLKQKLHPSRFSNISGKMSAIVGFILDERYSDPVIVDMTVTSDSMVLAQREGDCGMNDFIGAFVDMWHNWKGLLWAAELTDKERAWCRGKFNAKLHIN